MRLVRELMSSKVCELENGRCNCSSDQLCGSPPISEGLDDGPVSDHFSGMEVPRVSAKMAVPREDHKVSPTRQVLKCFLEGAYWIETLITSLATKKY